MPCPGQGRSCSCCSGKEGTLPTESKGQKGEKKKKAAVSRSDPTAILGKRHLNPASLEGNSCPHGQACPGTPLQGSRAKTNTCCDSHTCLLPRRSSERCRVRFNVTQAQLLPRCFQKRGALRQIARQGVGSLLKPVISINCGCSARPLFQQALLAPPFWCPPTHRAPQALTHALGPVDTRGYGVAEHPPSSSHFQPSCLTSPTP